MATRSRSAGWVAVAGAMVMAALGVSCGGGGGGGLSEPAFTNLAGTRWSQVDTVSAKNSCDVGIGVTDDFVEHVLAQDGNTLSIYDERMGQMSAENATISGYVIEFRGDRYPVGGCSTMTAAYRVTLAPNGLTYAGTATIRCMDNGCSVPVDVSGVRLQ